MVTSQQTGHPAISDSGRERRNRRILLISVVRLSPNLAAAPLGPPITQLVPPQGMKNMIALCLFKRDRAGCC